MMKLLIFLMIYYSTALKADSAYHFYQEEKYQEALIEFKKELNKEDDTKQQAILYKMIGICQFMIGKRQDAQGSFKKAKSLDPSLELRQSEVHDGNLVTFYDSVPRGPQKKQDQKDRKNEIKTEVKTVVLHKTIFVEKKEDPTTLSVKTNASQATIVLDGDLEFSQGKEIQVSPGEHKIVVSAKGYETSEMNIQVQAHKSERVLVELKKPKLEISNKSTKKVFIDKPKQKAEVSPWIPFGYSYFKDKQKGLGSLYAISESLTLGFALYEFYNAYSISLDTDAELMNRRAYMNSLSSQNEKDTYYSESISPYKTFQDGQVSDSYFYGTLSLTCFFGFWFLGSYFFESQISQEKTVTIGAMPLLEKQGLDIYLQIRF